MPTCGRVTHFKERRSHAGHSFVVNVDPASLRDHFVRLFKRSFRMGLTVNPGRDVSEISLVTKSSEVKEQLLEFLNLLSIAVTIDDDADCSHALGVHTLFDSEWGGSSGEKTYVGEVVSDAKYGHSDWSMAHLAELMTDFADVHPLYRQATHITCPPSSNGGPNTSGLAHELAQRVARSRGLPFVSIHGSRRESRKSKRHSDDCSDVVGTLQVIDCVARQTVLVVDDLYGHGCTVNETARALKERGASRVLALSGSKDANGCKGLPPQEDNWPDWYPAELDSPFK